MKSGGRSNDRHNRGRVVGRQRNLPLDRREKISVSDGPTRRRLSTEEDIARLTWTLEKLQLL